MKRFIFLTGLFLLFAVLQSHAQQCPGGGTTFSSAITFDPAWIYGCNTGTSCNGGVNFDNRNACEPTTSIDPCEPAPSCTNSSNNGSDIWFKFYASSATARISCFQNTSLVLGIQAFGGGGSCGSLFEIGCAVSGGPSSGVQLNLTGLGAGTVYYFRIFGSASPVSQRTGLYCFCGSTGLGNFIILPVAIRDFTAHAAADKINLVWNTSTGNANQSFDLERSTDRYSFKKLTSISEEQGNRIQTYQYTDSVPSDGINFYRLKHIYADGKFDYSNTVSVGIEKNEAFSIVSNFLRGPEITTSKAAHFILSDLSGKRLQTLSFLPGKHVIETAQLANGFYILQSVKTGKAQKFCVTR